MRLLLFACAGGAIGAGLRHLVNVGAAQWFGTSWPWGTLTVNVVGSFLMGLLIEALAHKFSGSLELRTFVATGVLGGLTTFSAFSLDFVVMVQRGEYGLAGLYVTLSVGAAIAALFAGLHMGRELFA